jgi:UPF0271 protein
MLVLDATAFIDEYESADERLATVPAVREELTDTAQFRYEAMEGSGMHIQVPGEAALDRIRRAARETGDLGVLSETDLRLLAATLELDATLVTDDYAMQNVADRLDLAVEVVAREGIAEQREWTFQCQGCGREFDERKERCPICGTELARKNPS